MGYGWIMGHSHPNEYYQLFNIVSLYFIVYCLCRVQFVSATRRATKESTARKVGGGNKTKWLLSASVIKLSASVRTTQLISAPGLSVGSSQGPGWALAAPGGHMEEEQRGVALINFTYTSHQPSPGSGYTVIAVHANKIHDRKWWPVLMHWRRNF